MTSRFVEMTLGSIVAEDYRNAAVLERFGLDFCCGGKRTLDEACGARGYEPAVVADAIEQARSTADPHSAVSDETWNVNELIAHIVSAHHGYVRQASPRIAGYLNKLIAVHGERHPELARVAQHFDELASELSTHMFKEEEILFPYVRDLAAVEGGAPMPSNVFGTVRNPIRMMEAEHTSAGQELAIVRELTDNYRTPADGCTTYRVCYQELEAFDDDLRRHIHLENNVLFPRAVAMERAVGVD